MIKNKIIAGMMSFTFLFGILSSDCSIACAKAWDSSDTGAVIGILGSIIGGSKSKKDKNKDKDSNSKVIKQTPYHKTLSYNEKMLMEAIRNNDGKTVIEMIKAGVDINTVYGDYYVNTPLGWAIHLKKRDMQQLLLSNGADVTGFVYGKSRVSYLCNAAAKGDLELFKYLHNWGADINETNEIKSVNNDLTIINNSLTTVLYYDASKNLLTPDYSIDTSEHLLNMVNYMLDEGIDPNFIQKDFINDRYNSPLTLAAGLSRLNAVDYIRPEIRRAIVKRLLEAGADANFKNSRGANAADIMISSFFCHPSDIEGAKLIQSYMK